MPEVLNAYLNTTKRIPTSVLNDIIEEAYNLNLPPTYKGKRLKIYYVVQESSKPPKFVFYVNNKNLVHFSLFLVALQNFQLCLEYFFLFHNIYIQS